MDLLSGMQGSEAQLKVLVDRLALVKDKGLSARSQRAYLRMLLRARLVAIRSTIDAAAQDLAGCEREKFAFQVRMGLPLFSHIESVINMADEGALEVRAA